MNDNPFYKNQLLLYGLLFFSAVAYYLLAYQTQRQNFIQVISLYTFLFSVYFVAYKFFSISEFKVLLAIGIVFRLLLIFSVPNFSDDVFRFIWDGRLAANGINPFSHLPTEIIQMPVVTGITNELYVQLNSAGRYTIYPPVLQGVFWIAAKIFPQNIFAAIVLMKSVIVVTELANLFLMIQILKKLSLPTRFSLLYFLNPLVIIEVTGNVHLEGLMIFFVLFAFLFLLKNKWQLSAIFLGLGIATKILPLLLIPLIFFKLGWKKGFIYTAICGFTALVLFTFIIDAYTLKHFLNSIDLYLRYFEFNASIYYLVRWIGELVTGYNIIAKAGPILSIMGAVIICVIARWKKNSSMKLFFAKALFIITVWFLFSTTIHPWYICLPLVLGVFTTYRFPVIWSFTAFFSYSAYQTNPVHENLWLVSLGYSLIFAYAIWELKQDKEGALANHDVRERTKQKKFL